MAFVWFAYLCSILAVSVNCNESIARQQLYEQLTGNYSKQVIPMQNSGQPVNVNVTFYPIKLLKFDNKDETLEQSASVKMTWIDGSLRWDTSQFGNVDEMHLPVNRVWMPDLYIINLVDGNQEFLNPSNVNDKITVRPSGKVTWWMHVNLKTICNAQMTYYPYDVQNCSLNFSKQYLKDNLQMLTYVPDHEGSNYLEKNGEWNIEPISYKEHKYKFGSNSHMTGFKILINMERKSEYYVWVFLIPSGALSILSCFTVIRLSQISNNLNVATLVFLANGILVRLFNENIPSNSDERCQIGILLWFVVSVSGIVVVVILLIDWFQKPKTESEKPKTESEKPKTESEKPKTESEKPKTESEKPKTESNESPLKSSYLNDESKDSNNEPKNKIQNLKQNMISNDLLRFLVIIGIYFSLYTKFVIFLGNASYEHDLDHEQT